MVAAAAVMAVALAPIWHVLVDVRLLALIWLAVLAWLRDAGQRAWASSAGTRGQVGSGQQQ